MDSLREAEKLCDPSFASPAVAELARNAMLLLEEGVERQYYTQEDMERLKGLVLSEAPEGITRPLKSKTMNEGFLGGLVGLVLLVGFVSLLSKSAGVHPLDLIITSDDNRFSLSRLQFWLWFVVVIISWGAISWATRRLYTVPDNLYILIGVNVAATVASSAIAVTKGVHPRANKPNFFKDIFMDSKQTLDLPRIQMFIWTIIIVVGYVAVVIEHYRQGLPSLPNIPEGLIVLMGISHGAYLGTKAAEKTVDSKSGASRTASAGLVAVMRHQADAGQKETIDTLLKSLGYTTWDDFMNGKPHPASQEQVDKLLTQLKAQGIQ
jgi:hypothetical protein